VRRKLEELLRGDDHITVCKYVPYPICFPNPLCIDLYYSACRILSCLQTLQPNLSSENEGLETYLDFLEKVVHKDATEFMKILVEVFPFPIPLRIFCSPIM
jgi:hypothetical protein